MAHHVTARAARQLAQVLPHPAQPRNVQQFLAGGEAGLHPGVMRAQVASPARAAERPAASADRAHPADELGEVMRERVGSARVLVVRRHSGQPGLHRPRKRVTRARLAERHRLRRAEPGASGQFAGGRRLLRQALAYHGDGIGLQREAGREVLADAEDGVDRPRRIHHGDGQAPPLRELLVHQCPHRLRGRRSADHHASARSQPPGADDRRQQVYRGPGPQSLRRTASTRTSARRPRRRAPAHRRSYYCCLTSSSASTAC